MCLNKKFTKEELNLNESLRISNEIERISNKSLQISYITNWNEFWRNLYEFETSSLRRMNGFWTNLYGFPTKLNEFRTDFQRNWTNSERISTDFQRNWMILKKPYIKNPSERNFNGFLETKTTKIERNLKTVFPLKESILNGITTKILTTFERNLNGLISLKIRSSFVNQSFVFRRILLFSNINYFRSKSVLPSRNVRWSPVSALFLMILGSWS